MSRVGTLCLTIILLMVAGLDAGCRRSKKNQDGGKNEGDKSDDGDTEEVAGEKPVEPVEITGAYLTFGGGRPRCSAKLISGTDDYQVLCQAVEIVNGVELVPGRLATDLAVEWLQPSSPNFAGLQVQQCTSVAPHLVQDCRVKVPATSSTVSVNFSLQLKELKPAAAGSQPRSRVESDVVILPYTIKTLGVVAEVPRVAAYNASGQTLYATASNPFADFPLADDSKLLSCGGKLYATSRSRLFVLEGGAARHIAGSINAGNIDDISHPLRTYWVTINSLACRGNSVFIATQEPTRIYEYTEAGGITIFAKENLEASVTEPQPQAGMFLGLPVSLTFDSKGNLYFLDGFYIRRVSTAGIAETLFDGTDTIFYPWALALDEDSKVGVSGFYLLDIGTGLSPTVFGIKAGTGAMTTIAGNGLSFDPADLRDGLSAKTFALRNAVQLSVIRSSNGERQLLIAEGGDLGSADGEVLSVNATGTARVVFKPGQLQLNSGLVNGVTGTATVGSGARAVVLHNDQYFLKVNFAANNELSTNIVTIPAAGTGSATWFAGRVPPPQTPVAFSDIDPKKLLLGNNISAFSGSGALFVVDNAGRNLYRVLPDNKVNQIAHRFSENVLSLAVQYNSQTKVDRLVYVEASETGNQVKELLLTVTAAGAPSTIISSPGCDIPVGQYPESPAPPNAATLACSPITVTLDLAGRVVFYDHGYRFIRRLESNKTFSRVAGTGVITAGENSRVSGENQLAKNLGLSIVQSLTYDKSGNLIFVDSGGYESNGDGNEPSLFLPLMGKIRAPQSGIAELDSAVETIVGSGETYTPELPVDAEIEATQLNLNTPTWSVVLPDGSYLLTDTDTIVTIRPAESGKFSVRRFFGGKQANVDCGLGAVDNAGAVKGKIPSLANSLGRYCAGSLLSLHAVSDCSGTGNESGVIQIAISQRLADASSTIGGGAVLKLELACKAIGSSLN